MLHSAHLAIAFYALDLDRLEKSAFMGAMAKGVGKMIGGGAMRGTGQLLRGGGQLLAKKWAPTAVGGAVGGMTGPNSDGSLSNTIRNIGVGAAGGYGLSRLGGVQKGFQGASNIMSGAGARTFQAGQTMKSLGADALGHQNWMANRAMLNGDPTAGGFANTIARNITPGAVNKGLAGAGAAASWTIGRKSMPLQIGTELGRGQGQAEGAGMAADEIANRASQQIPEMLAQAPIQARLAYLFNPGMLRGQLTPDMLRQMMAGGAR